MLGKPKKQIPLKETLGVAAHWYSEPGFHYGEPFRSSYAQEYAPGYLMQEHWKPDADFIFSTARFVPAWKDLFDSTLKPVGSAFDQLRWYYATMPGKRRIVTLAFSHPAFSDDPRLFFDDPKKTEACYQAYFHYCQDVINTAIAFQKQNPGYSFAFELWNEANIPPFWHADPKRGHKRVLFERFFQRVCKDLRSTYPGIKLMGPGYSGLNSNWLYHFAVHGHQQLVDVVTAHPYQRPNTPEKAIHEVNQVLGNFNKMGFPYQVGVTEWGYDTSTMGFKGKRITEEEQANLLARQVLLGPYFGFVVNCLYSFMDATYEEPARKPNTGYGLWTKRTARAKPAVYLLKHLIAELGDFVYQERLKAGHPANYALLFKHPATGQRKIAYWHSLTAQQDENSLLGRHLVYTNRPQIMSS